MYVIFQPQTDKDLRDAVDMWCTNINEALEKYGHISLWDTHKITDMSFLFRNHPEFNDDIRDWDVSNVTDMGYMFSGAKNFNQPIGGWDVSSVLEAARCPVGKPLTYTIVAPTSTYSLPGIDSSFPSSPRIRYRRTAEPSRLSIIRDSAGLQACQLS